MKVVDEEFLGLSKSWEFSSLKDFRSAAKGGKLGRSLQLSGDYRVEGWIEKIETKETKTYVCDYRLDVDGETPQTLFTIPSWEILMTLEDETNEVDFYKEGSREPDLKVGDLVEVMGSIPARDEPYELKDIMKY